MKTSVPQRRARNPRPATLVRREEILRAGMRVFGSKGYQKGSLAEIADEAGMTQAGVLHHFGSKDGLLRAVLAFRDKADVENMEGQHIPGGADLFRHLVDTVETNLQRRGIVQAYTVLVGESVTDDHPASAWATERFATLRTDISQALRDVVAAARASVDDERGPDDADDAVVNSAASAIIGLMDGLQMQWLLDPSSVDLVEATRLGIEAILAAVLAPPDRTPTT